MDEIEIKETKPSKELVIVGLILVLVLLTAVFLILILPMLLKKDTPEDSKPQSKDYAIYSSRESFYVSSEVNEEIWKAIEEDAGSLALDYYPTLQFSKYSDTEYVAYTMADVLLAYYVIYNPENGKFTLERVEFDEDPFPEPQEDF